MNLVQELGGHEVVGHHPSHEGVDHDEVEAPAGPTADLRAPVADDQVKPRRGAQPEPLAGQVDERPVALHDGHPRAWTGRGQPARQRARSAAHLKRPERRVRGTSGVEEPGDMAQVLELQARRVAEIDVACLNPVHQDEPPAGRAVAPDLDEGVLGADGARGNARHGPGNLLPERSPRPAGG